MPKNKWKRGRLIRQRRRRSRKQQAWAKARIKGKRRTIQESNLRDKGEVVRRIPPKRRRGHKAKSSKSGQGHKRTWAWSKLKPKNKGKDSKDGQQRTQRHSSGNQRGTAQSRRRR